MHMLCHLWRRVFGIRETWSERIQDEANVQRAMLDWEEVESDSEPEHVEGDACLLRRLENLQHLERVDNLEDLMSRLELDDAPEGPAPHYAHETPAEPPGLAAPRAPDRLPEAPSDMDVFLRTYGSMGSSHLNMYLRHLRLHEADHAGG